MDEPTAAAGSPSSCARPLLNLFWPELAGFVQPLAGEYAGRRERAGADPVRLRLRRRDRHARSTCCDLVGLDALAQVDLGERRHRHQDTEALGRMAAQILVTAWSRLHRQRPGGHPRPPADAAHPVPPRAAGRAAWTGDAELTGGVVTDVAVAERPPLATRATRAVTA